MVSDQWSEKAKLGFAVLNPTYGLSIGNRKGTLWEKNGRGDRISMGFLSPSLFSQLITHYSFV